MLFSYTRGGSIGLQIGRLDDVVTPVSLVGDWEGWIASTFVLYQEEDRVLPLVGAKESRVRKLLSVLF